MTDRRVSRTTPDVAIALLLLIATVALFVSLPRDLGTADEAFFLYEARRIREGEVMYRDFFQFVAPGAWYVMAALYWLFGTTMATARISMAVIYGLTVALTYGAARVAGVRRELAVLPPLAFVAICQPAWPYASPHWFSTLLIAVLLFTALREDGARRPWRSLALGVEAGVFIGVQQQKGAIFAVGIAILIVIDELTRVRFGDFSFRIAVRRLQYLILGGLLAVVPLFGSMILAAGWQPVYQDLFVYPVYEYKGGSSGTWGNVTFLSAAFSVRTWPVVLKYLPAAIVLPLLRAAALLVAGGDPQRLRILITLVVFGGVSVLSTIYNADFIHITFIAPALFVTVSESLEWLLKPRRLRRASRAAGWVAALLIAVLVGRKLYENVQWSRSISPFPHETAFGRVDFGARWEGIFIDQARKLFAETGTQEVFCYPFLASPYLTTGARNPTPYQHLSPSQSPARHLEESLSILRERRVPYIIAAPLFLKPSDPIAQLIDEKYELVPIPEIGDIGELARVWLFRRNDLPPEE